MHLGLEGVVPATLWIGMVVVFFLSVFKDPVFGLYLLIPLLPLETVRYRLHGYFLGAQFVDVLLLGTIIGLKRKHQQLFPQTPLSRLLFIFIIFTYLSLIQGSFVLGLAFPVWFDNHRLSDWKNAVVDLSLMFFVTNSAIRTIKHMRYLLTAMCIGVLLLTKNFHSAIAGRDFSSFSYNLRDSGTVGDAGVNGLAALAAQVAIFFTAQYFFERRLFPKLGFLAPALGAVYCVLFALSRGAYAALLIGLILLGVFRSRLLLLCITGFLLVWQTVVPTAVRERIFMTKDASGQVDHSAEARIDLWEEAIQSFQSDPLLGTGFNTYAYRSHVGGYEDSHNLYVKVLVETGVVGLCLFLAIFGKLFQMGCRLYRSATDSFLKGIGLGFAAMMLAVFVGNFFGDRWMYFQITGYTYALAAIVARAQELSDEALNPEEVPLECSDAVLRLEPVG